jgi:hypothetical protein
MSNMAINEKKQNKNDSVSDIVIDNIFSELKGAYPAWRQSWQTEEDIAIAKSSWKQTLIDSKIKGLESIQRGLKRCREDAGVLVPSAGQFVKWCEEQHNEILDRNGNPLLSATEAYSKSFDTKPYFASSSHETQDQDMITRFVITLCGGDATYRGMKAEVSRRAFLSNYSEGVARWKEVYAESLSRKQKLNMYFNPLLEHVKEKADAEAKDSVAEFDTKAQSTLTAYEQFKLDIGLCKEQKPSEFGKQFKHLTPEKHVEKIMEISEFSTEENKIALRKLPPIDLKFYPIAPPEPSYFDLKKPELYAKHKALRELAAQREAQEQLEMQPKQRVQEQQEEVGYQSTTRQEKCSQEPVLSQEHDYACSQQPQEDYRLAIECNDYQEQEALPETPSYCEEWVRGGWHPIANTPSQAFMALNQEREEYYSEIAVLSDLKHLEEELEAA